MEHDLPPEAVEALAVGLTENKGLPEVTDVVRDEARDLLVPVAPAIRKQERERLAKEFERRALFAQLHTERGLALTDAAAYCREDSDE